MVVGGMAKIADRLTEGQPDGKKQSMEAMAAPCLKIARCTKSGKLKRCYF